MTVIEVSMAHLAIYRRPLVAVITHPLDSKKLLKKKKQTKPYTRAEIVWASYLGTHTRLHSNTQ